jgi:phenylpropionate dioxygenase-like ring-hydroxylating dioxygenase large terminal subunit
MSDLGSAGKLARSNAQLPVSAYFDRSLYSLEIERIFGKAPRYVGHSLMIPEVGDYHALAQEREGRVLVRSAGGIHLMSNVCRHRQAIIKNGRGNTGRNVVCPLHRWTYDLDGKLLGAPHFDDNPCLDLGRTPLSQWNGLLFERPTEPSRDVAAELAGVRIPELDFDGYLFDRVEIHECAYNWKTFIEVYLEDYHVGPFHPGLGQFVSCEELSWQYGAHHSVQIVGINSSLTRPGTETYRAWHDQVIRLSNGVAPAHGAIWLTLYPNVMVEWYPHVLVVSTLIPRGPQHTTNVVEFYYPEEVALFERDFVEANRAAYLETCVEDDEIALRMDAGRRALYERGENQVGPYQSPMEDGMQHFHEWLRRELDRDEIAAIDAR